MDIAIVDDNPKDSGLLKKYVEKYFEEHPSAYRIHVYANGLDFLDELDKNFSIVFMDVEMPHLNGIETARSMRKSDQTAALIFITNMAQYAIHGYEVNAIEYMVKPVGYYNFSDKMSKALEFAKRDTEKYVLLHNEDMFIKLPVSKIYYLEKDKNYIIFHTEKGDYRERGSMSEMEKKLSGAGFSKCISGCLVNLRHVSQMSKDAVWVHETCLPLSRSQKKLFVKEFTDFLGGVVV